MTQVTQLVPQRRPSALHARMPGALVVRVERRSLVYVSVVMLLTAALLLVQLVTGDYPLPLSRVLATLQGRGTASEEFIVYTLRLPRELTAVLAGAAFGASGAVYQSITRNPLGSPDIIGFTYGAAFGAVLGIVVLGQSDTAVTVSAVAGGLAVAALVYVLSYRGGVSGYRLILVGIGVSSVLASFISYLLMKAQIVDAQEAYVWLTGSLNGRSWMDVQIGLVGTALLAPLLIGLGPGLRMSEMGDDTARALGVNVGRNRVCALGFGAVLCAVAVVCAGPITFISLAAPQIAKRLCRSATVRVVPAMATGSFLLLLSDTLVQLVAPTTQLPVGIATLVLGGSYLAWLIAREGRTRIA
jgi:iron complex transport system permease protein